MLEALWRALRVLTVVFTIWFVIGRIGLYAEAVPELAEADAEQGLVAGLPELRKRLAPGPSQLAAWYEAANRTEALVHARAELRSRLRREWRSALLRDESDLTALARTTGDSRVAVAEQLRDTLSAWTALYATLDAAQKASLRDFLALHLDQFEAEARPTPASELRRHQGGPGPAGPGLGGPGGGRG